MESKHLATTRTTLALYIFLDVIDFTSKMRTVEAQTDVINRLNEIVHESVLQIGLQGDNVVYSPTGDGMCIALIGADYNPLCDPPYDVHIRLALRIIQSLDEHNQTCLDDTRKFVIRIGLNQNVDNVIIDVNGRQGLAGSGINMAQRVMDQAGAMQITVGEGVFQTLSQRERYHELFKAHTTILKNGGPLTFYQFLGTESFLNTDALPGFAERTLPRQAISRLEAYYIYYADQNKTALEIFVTTPIERDAAVVWLFIKATDSALEKSLDTLSPAIQRLKGGRSADEQLKYYGAVDIWVIDALADRIMRNDLQNICSSLKQRCFASDRALAMLKEDWPDIP